MIAPLWTSVSVEALNNNNNNNNSRRIITAELKGHGVNVPILKMMILFMFLSCV